MKKEYKVPVYYTYELTHTAEFVITAESPEEARREAAELAKFYEPPEEEVPADAEYKGHEVGEPEPYSPKTGKNTPPPGTYLFAARTREGEEVYLGIPAALLRALRIQARNAQHPTAAVVHPDFVLTQPPAEHAALLEEAKQKPVPLDAATAEALAGAGSEDPSAFEVLLIVYPEAGVQIAVGRKEAPIPLYRYELKEV